MKRTAMIITLPKPPSIRRPSKDSRSIETA